MKSEKTKVITPNPGEESLRKKAGYLILLAVCVAAMVGCIMVVQHSFHQMDQIRERVVSECEAVNGTFSGSTLSGTCTRNDGTVIIPSAIIP